MDNNHDNTWLPSVQFTLLANLEFNVFMMTDLVSWLNLCGSIRTMSCISDKTNIFDAPKENIGLHTPPSDLKLLPILHPLMLVTATL